MEKDESRNILCSSDGRVETDSLTGSFDVEIMIRRYALANSSERSSPA